MYRKVSTRMIDLSQHITPLFRAKRERKAYDERRPGPGGLGPWPGS
jgi:hypothetical protein